MAQVNDQMAKCRLISPVEGIVLNKYVTEKETVTQGDPLYRIADVRQMFLCAYIAAQQSNKLRPGQSATVFLTLPDGVVKSCPGTVTWISDKAVIPKTVRTKDKRQNPVYAVKIAVANTDGLIKTGMQGNADFK
jgi:HlyD family secretion protein